MRSLKRSLKQTSRVLANELGAACALCLGAISACVAATLAGAFLSGKGFPCLQAGDGLAVSMACAAISPRFVMLYHFILYTEVTRLNGVWSRPTLGFFDSLGPGSVNLFFMTTGFLFYPRVLKGLGTVSWTSVYISRVFRIIPLVVFAVLASALLTLARMNFHPAAPIGQSLVAMLRWIICWDQPDLFGYPGSGQLGSVLWSLWFEWLFYLFVLPGAPRHELSRSGVSSWMIPAGLIVMSVALKPLHLFRLSISFRFSGLGCSRLKRGTSSIAAALEITRSPL